MEAERVTKIAWPISGCKIKPMIKSTYNINDNDFPGAFFNIDSDINQDIKTTKAGFANSDGCSEIIPRSIHLVAPLISAPKILMKNIEMSDTAKISRQSRRIFLRFKNEKNIVTKAPKTMNINCFFTK